MTRWQGSAGTVNRHLVGTAIGPRALSARASHPSSDREDRRRLAEFLGEPDKKSSGPADVAEPIRVFVLDHFAADELRAALAEPGERIVDVVHGEHDA